jgi:hypothetical protein
MAATRLPDAGHVARPAPLPHGRDGRLEAPGLGEPERERELAEPVLDQRAQPGEARLLLAVVRGQPLDLGQAGAGLGRARLVGVQVGAVAGEQVAALPGLGVGDGAEQPLQGELDPCVCSTQPSTTR